MMALGDYKNKRMHMQLGQNLCRRHVLWILSFSFLFFLYLNSSNTFEGVIVVGIAIFFFSSILFLNTQSLRHDSWS